MAHDSEPPLEDCERCSAWRLGRVMSRLLWILVPILIGLAVTGAGAAATSLVRDADTRSTVRSLQARRVEASEERRRLAAEARASEREAAHHREEEAARWTQVSAALARIEARLDSLEDRRPRRRRSQ